MIANEIQQRFIQHRAEGMSFNNIATNLNVSRGTLMTWSRKFQLEIANLRAMNMEQLRQKFLKTYADEINTLGERLRAIDEEIKKRNLSDIPTKQLVAWGDELRQEIRDRTGNLQFRVPVTEPAEKPAESIDEWSA